MIAPKPVTAERIEAALDRIAEIMIDLGTEGPVLLPLYERLERELDLVKSVDSKMAAIRGRVKQSKARRASPQLS